MAPDDRLRCPARVVADNAAPGEHLCALFMGRTCQIVAGVCEDVSGRLEERDGPRVPGVIEMEMSIGYAAGITGSGGTAVAPIRLQRSLTTERHHRWVPFPQVVAEQVLVIAPQ